MGHNGTSPGVMVREGGGRGRGKERRRERGGRVKERVGIEVLVQEMLTIEKSG